MNSLEELYQLLNADEIDIDAIELAESLWLSQYISKTEMTLIPDNDTNTKLDNNSSSIKNESSENTSEIKQTKQEKTKDAPLHPIGNECNKDSLPFRTPLVHRLYKDNDLIYAFRHFKQKIVSPEQSILDEEKIADYMAQTDIFSPFYKKSYEKRFNILFIVDVSESMKIWDSLIEEFIKDVKKYHIFKEVTTYYILTDNNTPDLFKKKKKTSRVNDKWYRNTEQNTLTFMLSDMVAKSWSSGKLLSDIMLWQQYVHFAIVQMLPQRLWNSTKLIDASIGKMSNHKKFSLNTKIQSRAEEILAAEGNSLPELVKIPLLNFDESSIDAYGRVMNSLLNNRIDGALFEREDFEGEYQFSNSNSDMSAEDRLRSFYKYASRISKDLLELLAVVPLSLSIIKLIQQELLPQSTQEHLSEVFTSGIIDKEQKVDGFYQFYKAENEQEGLREELIKKIGAKKAFQTIVKLSEVINKQGGVFDFLAYVIDPITLKKSNEFSELDREFARVSVSVLKEMGGQYKDLADRLQDDYVCKDNANSDQLDIPRSTREQLTKNNSNKSTFTWKDIFREEVEKPYFKKLQNFLNDEEKDGKTILPKKEDWYKSLDSTRFSSVKVVILGASPYHGIGQADGLAYSVLPNTKLPPSLINIFKELKDDLNIDYNDVGSLQSWAEQGVLLLNSVLTVEENKANSHTNKGWEIFTSKILEAINNERENIVFILWGYPSQKLGENINVNKHFVIKSPHPSPLSSYRGFFGSKPFSKTNDYLQGHNIKPIDWSLSKTEKQLIQDDDNTNSVISDITFDCEECNTEYSINCKELHWEQIGGSERNMGLELEYEAEYYETCHECDNDMSITFSCWEYPVGAEGYRDVLGKGIKNLKGDCCLKFNSFDKEYTEDYDEFTVSADTSYSTLEEKIKELETFVNNLIPYSELEFMYDSEDFSNEKDIPFDQFLISREFDSQYLDDLIDEIKEDINEVQFALDYNSSDNLGNNISNNSLLLKKQYTVEYDDAPNAYGVDIDCNVYEEDNKQILYIYPSSKIEFDEDILDVEEEIVDIDIDKAEAEMKEWFFKNYEDPANFLPYTVYGSPYKFDEILYKEFGDKYPDYYIQKAIENLENEHGDISWTKRPKEDRDLEIIKSIKKYPVYELSHFFIISLQMHGVNSGIIDRLMTLNKRCDFLYELYKILDEATRGTNQENRQNIINDFCKKIDFEFNFINDYMILRKIFDNCKKYNEIHNIESDEENLNIDKAEEEMKDWFLENYDDPVNFLPHESREGGFQYLYGGPYELDEILYEEFGGKYPDDYIQKVVENLEHEHGDIAWGKRPSETDVYEEGVYAEKGYTDQKVYIPSSGGKVYEFDVSNKFYDINIYKISEQAIKESQALKEMIVEKGATHQGTVSFHNDIKGNIDELNKLIKDFQDIFGQEKGLSFYSIMHSEDDIYKYNSKTSKNIDIDNVINATIDGDFEGWSGESIVKLTNGETWKQSEYYYEYIYAFMPNAIITHSQTGYKMKVDGVNEEVGVEKLKNVIESKIRGSFNGWSGNTIVELINDEKWKQSTYKYSYSYAYSPDVIIYQSDYGFKMKVDGNNETVDVERVI